MFSFFEAVVVSNALYENRQMTDFAQLVQRDHVINSVMNYIMRPGEERAYINRAYLIEKLERLTEAEAERLRLQFREIGRVVNTPIMRAKLVREGIISRDGS